MDSAVTSGLFDGEFISKLPSFSSSPVDYVRLIRDKLSSPAGLDIVDSASNDNITSLFKFICENLTNADPKLSMELRVLLKILLKCLKQRKPQFDYQPWTEITLALPPGSKAPYLIFEHLGVMIPSPMSWGLNPEFYSEAFFRLRKSTDANPVSKCLASLLRFRGKRDSELAEVTLWLDSWVPMLNAAILRPERDNVMRYFLPLMIKQEPRSFEDLFSRVSTMDDSAKIGVLKAAQSVSVNLDGLALNSISNVLHHKDRTLRFEAFSLIFLTQKLSARISVELYNLIRAEANSLFCEPNPKFRGEMKMAMTHFIDRIRASVYAYERDTKTSDTSARDEATEFIKWLLEFIRLNLRPLCPYRSLITACTLLEIVVASGIDKSIDPKFVLKTPVQFPFNVQIFSEDLTHVLATTVLSNYQDIRVSASRIFSMIPQQQTANFGGNIEMYLRDKANTLLAGVRGRQADAGARTALLLFQMKHSIDEQKVEVQALISEIKNRMKLVEANESLKGSSAGSIHGYLAALGLIVQETAKTFDAQFKSELTSELIGLTFEAWKLTEDILTYSAPEGNGPQMLPDGTALVEEDEDAIGVSKDATIMRWQNILSFAWRTLKESSEMVASLVASYELNDEQLSELCKLTVRQITTVRHKGAFASVTAPLTVLFKQCLCSENQELQLLPKSCVFEQLELAQHDKRLITRRSAGLPLLVTTYLSSLPSAPQAAEPESEELYQYLINLADTSKLQLDGTNKMDLPQVHAFNCIRAIIRDANLTNKSASLMERALILSINTFDNPIWSIKNCAAMLFSSLHTRLFTPKCHFISGRSFFFRFPLMNSFLYTHLQKQLAQNGSFESFYPILALLLRLRPGRESSDLDAFVPMLVTLLSNKAWDIRESAAAALASITRAAKQTELFKTLVETSSISNQNALHGNMMAVAKFIETSEVAAQYFASSDVRQRLLALFPNNRCPETLLQLARVCERLQITIPATSLPDSTALCPSAALLRHKVVLQNLQASTTASSDVSALLDGPTADIDIAVEFLKEHRDLPGVFDKLSAVMAREGTSLFLRSTIINEFGDKLSLQVGDLIDLIQMIPSELAKQKLLIRLAEVIQFDSNDELTWWNQIESFSKENSALESRLCCLRSIATYLVRVIQSGGPIPAIALQANYRLLEYLSDDDERVRNETVSVCTLLLNGEAAEISVGRCEQLWLAQLDPKVALQVLARTAAAVHNATKDSFDTLFAAEDANLYRDNYLFYGNLYERAGDGFELYNQIINGMSM